MANATDIFNEIKNVNSHLDGVNGRLDDVNGKLDDLKAATDAVQSSVNNVDNTLHQGFNTLITLGIYTNQALYHNSEQNDTMICMLEQISRNTCQLVNQSYLQTGLQTAIEKNTEELADLYAATHAEAALTREREEALRQQIEKCCPPKPPEPVCRYERCWSPEPLGEPPQVDQRPPIG